MCDEVQKQEGCCCAGSKQTRREASASAALQNRLKRMEGQLRGIRTMLEQDAYCVEILTQTAAVSAALASFEREMLTAHLRGCVLRDLRSGDDALAEESLQELSTLLGRLLK